MSDTLGGLVDKLITIDMKMWNNQEMLYEIRRMTLDEFKAKYYANPDEGAALLHECLKKCCDLNVQRNVLIDEIDEKVIEMIEVSQSGETLDAGKFIQRKHKTY